MELEARLDVRYVVFVDDVALGQLIQHAEYRIDLPFGLFAVSSCTQFTNRVTGGLVVVSVVRLTLGVLTDALEGRLVVSHGCLSKNWGANIHRVVENHNDSPIETEIHLSP